MLFDSKAQYGEEEGTIRHLTLRYLTEVKHGQYQGVPPQRWKLVGMEGYEPQRAIVKRLLNEGVIQVPTTDDGRYTNVASINVKTRCSATPKITAPPSPRWSNSAKPPWIRCNSAACRIGSR